MAALSLIVKAVDTMSTWADKINLCFTKADANEAGVAALEAADALLEPRVTQNETDIGLNTTAIGLNTTASGNNTTKNTTQDGRLDDLEAVPPAEVPTTADTFVFTDVTSGDEKTGLVRDIVVAGQLNAITAGAITVPFTSSVTPTAIPTFGDTFYSSAVTGVTDPGDGLGLVLNVPVKYHITITGSVAAGIGLEFHFQIYIAGVACGREITVTGDGATKYMSFALQCITETVTPGSAVELRVHDDGNDIDLLDADMRLTFAGL